MKRLVLPVFFLLPIFTAAQKLSFSNIPLTWSDFKPSNSVSGLHAADISIKLKYKILPEESSGNITYYIKSDIHIDRTQTQVTKGFIEAASGFEKEKILRHEKGHLILTAIHHAKFLSLVSSFHFTSSYQRELDSIFTRTLAELETSNISYDNETNHGLGAAQGTWEQNLILELGQIYNNEDDILKPVNTSLHFINPLFKLNDPISYNYEGAELILNYGYQDAGISKERLAPFVIQMEDPAADGADSMLGIRGIDFTKNFEIELSISSENKNEKEGMAFFWAIADSAESMGIVISHAKLKYIFCRGGDHKNDETKAFFLKHKLGDRQNLLAIRHINEKYFIFMNGQFELELPYEPLPGRKLLIAPLKKGNTYQNLKIISLKN